MAMVLTFVGGRSVKRSATAGRQRDPRQTQADSGGQLARPAPVRAAAGARRRLRDRRLARAGRTAARHLQTQIVVMYYNQ